MAMRYRLQVLFVFAEMARRHIQSPGDESLQVVPQLSANNSLNSSHMTNQSAHSYSQQPLRLQTFSPAPKSEQGTLDRKGHLNTAFVNMPPATDISPIKPDSHSPKHFSPDSKTPVKQDKSPYSTYGTMLKSPYSPVSHKGSPASYKAKQYKVTPYNGKEGKGYHSDAETEETLASDDDGTIQYSCADMTDATYARTPRRLQIVDTDDATTTSGSYVVDPQDLCQEIDDLFFRDMVV